MFLVVAGFGCVGMLLIAGCVGLLVVDVVAVCLLLLLVIGDCCIGVCFCRFG